MLREVKVTTVRESSTTYHVNSPEQISSLWKSEVTKSDWYDADKEMMVVFMMNAKNYVTGYNLVSIGLLDSSLVHPREIFKPAIVSSAKRIVIAHNHPSNDFTPSAEDIRITKQIADAGRVLMIPLEDHVIVIEKAKNDSPAFYSLRENGLCDFTARD